MPWKTITPHGRDRAICYVGPQWSVHDHDLCEQFGISRKTGYKHLERFAVEGLKGRQLRSHRSRVR